MRNKNVDPKQLCQILESALAMIGMDTDGAYLLADDCYGQFAPRYHSGASEQLEQSFIDYSREDCIAGVSLLQEISMTPWVSFCARIVTALGKEEEIDAEVVYTRIVCRNSLI